MNYANFFQTIVVISAVIKNYAFAYNETATIPYKLDFGFYQCSLRVVAKCISELTSALSGDEALALKSCQQMFHIGLQFNTMDPFPNCKPLDYPCWLTCNGSVPPQHLESNATKLSSPKKLAVRWADGPASNANDLILEWDPVPGATLYFGQFLSLGIVPPEWENQISRLNVSVGHSSIFKMESICIKYKFIIAAARLDHVGPYSGVVSSPELFPPGIISKVELDPWFVEISRISSFYATDALIGIDIKIFGLPDEAYYARLSAYRLTTTLFVRQSENSKLYTVFSRDYLEYANGAARLFMPAQFANFTCDLILYVDSFIQGLCPTLKVSKAFRLKFEGGNKYQSCELNSTLSLMRHEERLGVMEMLHSSDSVKMVLHLQKFIAALNRTVMNKKTAIEYKVDYIHAASLTKSRFIPNWMALTNNTVELPESPPWLTQNNLIIGLSVCTLIALVLVVTVKLVSKKRKAAAFSKEKEKTSYDSLYSEYPFRIQRDEWEVLRDEIRILDKYKLGSGAFGSVYKGYLYYHTPVCKKIRCHENESEDGALVVAVKSLPQYASPFSMSNFREEIELMKTLGYHERLVNIVACVTKTEPFLLAVEYCSEGDLLRYLKDRRAYMIKLEKIYESLDEAMKRGQNLDLDMVLTLEDILCFAWQVACGMQYLSDKGFIHRDVAARNILVDKGKIAKVGDFGLCRFSQTEAIYSSRGGRLPVKWMALESLKDAEFTTASDVWSYGVLLFELVTLGGSPYPNVDPVDMEGHLGSGGRMDRPDNCSDELFELMLSTWEADPSARPNFLKIQETIRIMIESLTNQNYYLALNESKDYYNVMYNDPKTID